MRKIGIIVNQKKPGAFELLPKLKEWLEKREVEVADSFAGSADEAIRGAELLICLGGDGTLLSVADRMKEVSIPVLGVNLGSLGFLTEVKQDEIFEELNSYFLGQSVLEDRLMLSCTVQGGKTKQVRRMLA